MSVGLPKQLADLTIEADGANTRLASAWLANLASEFQVPVAEVDRLDLCLNEALANIIRHGAHPGKAPLIHLVLQVEREAGKGLATVTVSDAGPAFDTSRAHVGQRPTSLAEAEPGGLGLLMIQSFSDFLRYHYSDGQNHLSFGVCWLRSNE